MRSRGFSRLFLSIGVGVMALSCVAGLQAQQGWTKPTQEELAMTAEPKAPGADAVYLFREEVTDDSFHSESVHVRIKVLTDAGRARANVSVRTGLYVDYFTWLDRLPVTFSVSGIEGRTIHPDGLVIPYKGKASTDVVRGSTGRNTQVTRFALPDVTAGSIVEYRYKIIQNPLTYSSAYMGMVGGTLPPTWYVQNDLYLESGHFVWSPISAGPSKVGYGDKLQGKVAWAQVLPPGYSVVQTQQPLDKDVTLGVAGRFQPGSVPARFELNIRDVPPLPDEIDRLPAGSVGYRVHLYYASYNTLAGSWEETKKDMRKASEDYLSHGSSVAKIVQGLVLPSDTDEEKLRKLYAAVMGLENMDYLPTTATEELKKAESKVRRDTEQVWSQKEGTSPQLAALFVSLARAAGFQAYLMAVGSRSRQMFFDQYPVMAQMTDRIAIVVVDGKERFFDPGSRYCPFAQLAWNHMAMKGVRETRDGTAFAETPTASYKDTVITRTADLNIDAAGAVTGKVDLLYTGAAALEWRQTALVDGEQALKEKLTAGLQQGLPKTLTVTASPVGELTSYDRPLSISFQVQGSVGQASAGRLELPADLFEANGTNGFSSDKRESPVMFEYCSSTTDKVRWHSTGGWTGETLPAESTAVVNRAGLYELKAASVVDGVSVERRLMIGEVFWPVADYPKLRAFLATVQRKDKEPVVLRSMVAKELE